jgi:surfactin synthase thioesterase subunit
MPGILPSRADPWIRFGALDPGARLRLFCFPYAGGGASIFRNWAGRFPKWIDVCPVQLPGREERLREPAFTDMDKLCTAVLRGLTPYFDIPVAFFGHSMGALIAYHLATRLRDQARRLSHLLVSAHPAPHFPLTRPPSYNLPDALLAERLRRLNGTSELVLQDPELMALMRPLLRADFELSECTPRTLRDPLDCPVTALGGRADHEFGRLHLEAWREVTRGAFRLHMMPGDHFYLFADEAQTIGLIAECLASHNTPAEIAAHVRESPGSGGDPGVCRG